ncbi:hypothetical protein MW046_08525 [Halocatena salina]|uniref:PIN domain-containing protein n=1 Tax=Halocatena salina TaxID=2934340 RepID=A0A8U0A5H9_9EURY|nr:hypothetical protein MW046_08525 [Halocatena salina]
MYHGAVKEERDPVHIDDDLPWVERLEYTQSHVREGARIRQELKENGQQIQHPDMILAGVARSLDVPLVTADTGFKRIHGPDIDNHRELY